MQSYHYDTAPIPNKGKEPATAYSLKSLKDRPQVLNSTIFNPQTVLDTSKSYGALEVPNGHHRAPRRSSTWTSSTGDLGLLSEGEAVDDREQFVSEYNRLAKKYGIRLLVPGDFAHGAANASNSLPSRKGRWISKVLRQTSSGQISQPGNVKRDQWLLRQRRSISDMAMSFVHHHHYHHKKHGLEDESLPALVRLCGKSLFYLPSEYAPCALVLPTCFRALAQALVQQADSRGIFRVPGSVRIVNTLYDYYCADRDADDVSSTTRSPNLPNHIKYSVHDVASVFKKFLAGLPGGILGSLSLLDALVAIHSQLHGDPELTRTKETKLRARLIALAIGTVKSQYQRELICAVFGLLCLIGRVAENMPREDEQGRPLPTADLMGYNALSIVFGPLLVGDLIDSYNTKLANPAAGLVLLPVTPPRSRKERHKKSKTRAEDANASFTVDKIHVANSITEMLVTNWREVVRHMRSLATLKIRRNLDSHEHRSYRGVLKTSASASDSFPLRKPPGWDEPGSSTWQKDRNVSPLTMINADKASGLIQKGSEQTQYRPMESTVTIQQGKYGISCTSREGKTVNALLGSYLFSS
ncbi:hypothetical protein F4779DRAFT_492804 [Xylariaceae sp. FL0662B]|nr:hypothetical protein F4779DRAFT_492804 [Xylariaceae sp. FL0662B]